MLILKNEKGAVDPITFYNFYNYINRNYSGYPIFTTTGNSLIQNISNPTERFKSLLKEVKKMEVQFLVDEKNKIKAEIKDEGHTLCNPLVKELWKDDKVEVAGYTIDHSLVSNPFLIVEGDDAKNSLRKAVSRLKKKIDNMDDKFKKAK